MIDYKMIFLLNQCGSNVLWIDKQLFIVFSWIPADNHSYFKHSLNGILVTELVSSKLHTSGGLSNQAINEVMTIINNSKMNKIDFSADYQWQLFMAN